jgi:hypothetical protein
MLHPGHSLFRSTDKLIGLARYAEDNEDNFFRIESIDKIDGEVMIIDLTEVKSREVVNRTISAMDSYKIIGKQYDA